MSAVSAAEQVPSSVNGLPTDVIPVGDLKCYARPTPCGVSAGHHAITAGTLGCLVQRTAGGVDRFILSNNHVLVDSNAGTLGDNILEPGPMDGGTRPIALLTDFEPLDFSGGNNSIDAAIARLIQVGEVTPDIRIIGPAASPLMPAALYQSVRKHGRTTAHTVGVIMDLAADVRVRYGTSIAEFIDQIAVVGVGGSFSDGGDSGSLIVDAVTKRPVALLFAGGGGTTFANPIQTVLDRFAVEIL